MERKLVTKRIIDNITPIEGADRIEAAHIGGWVIVVAKGEFAVGQEVLFFEVDSMLPIESEMFAFLANRGVIEKEGKQYHRLRSMKLRGQISQGLILAFPENLPEADDYAEALGVIKYERPIFEGRSINTDKAGNFPDFLVKTDEERIQNLAQLLEQIEKEDDWENWYATEKIDGTSMTIFAVYDEGQPTRVGVCSRNFEVKDTEGSVYWSMAKRPLWKNGKTPLDLVRDLAEQQQGIVSLQGEVFGPKINDNNLKTKDIDVRFFSLYIGDKLLTAREAHEYMPELYEHWVPIIPVGLPHTMEEIIKQPDGITSLVPGAAPNTQIEGIVWRHMDKGSLTIEKDIDISKIPEEKRELVSTSIRLKASFKAISNKYLLKHE